MGQCSCCGATDEVLQHPTEFSMGVAALAAGRFTYADHLFDTAMESHSGCAFWKELRGAAGCQPPEEEKMAEAQLSSTCDARRSLAECWCWRTNPASTTCTRAACGSSSMCVELNVSEAELLPKLDYLRLVADVAMAYTRARYEEQALHYWHPITVCAHELLELIEQRLQRGLLWLKVMMKSEEAPQHPTFPAEGYEWRRRSSASLHVLQGREMRIQQVLVGLQQVLCRYNTCTLMQYGMMLLEEGTHANAILRESADAMSDDEQHEWMKATSCLPTSLPPLTSVARLSAMRHLHMCKIHQVHERSVVMMRQLLLMACKRTGSFFNMQVKGWIGQAIAMMNDENTADADGSLMRGGGSCSTLDSLGGGGGGASTHGGPTRRFHAPEEQTLTLAIKMSDGAAQDNVMTLLVAGEEASLRYAPTEIMGNVLPTMFVGHVASFVANMKMDDVDACAHNTGGLPNDVRPESHHHSIIKTHGSLVGRARAESIGNTTKFVRKILTSTKQSEEDELHAYQDINTALFPCTNSHDSTYFVKSRMLQSGLKDEESLLLMFGLLLLRVKMFLHVDATTPALNSLKQRLECMVKEVYGDEGLMSQLLLDCCHRLPSTSHWLGV